MSKIVWTLSWASITTGTVIALWSVVTLFALLYAVGVNQETVTFGMKVTMFLVMVALAGFAVLGVSFIITGSYLKDQLNRL